MGVSGREPLLPSGETEGDDLGTEKAGTTPTNHGAKRLSTSPATSPSKKARCLNVDQITEEQCSPESLAPTPSSADQAGSLMLRGGGNEDAKSDHKESYKPDVDITTLAPGPAHNPSSHLVTSQLEQVKEEIPLPGATLDPSTELESTRRVPSAVQDVTAGDQQTDSLTSSGKDIKEQIRRPTEYEPSPLSSPSETPDATLDHPSQIPDRWHKDQTALNIVLNARNEYSLMPTTWKISLRGIPLPAGLFYVKTKAMAERPRIYGHIDKLEYRGVSVILPYLPFACLRYVGAMALRKLIDVHGRIRDLRVHQGSIQKDTRLDEAQREAHERVVVNDIVRQVKKSLEEALNWTCADGQFRKYGDDELDKPRLPRTVTILELKDDTKSRQEEIEFIQDEMDHLADQWRDALVDLPGFVEDDGHDGDRYNGDEDKDEDEGQDEGQDEEEEGRRRKRRKITHDTDKVDDDKTRPKAPVVFGFVIRRHVCFIVSMDASNPEAVPNIPLQFNMEEYNQHQWNALAIMVTMCWARDIRMRMVRAMDLESVDVGELSDDPDV
jgi:hypothetical protein